MYAGPPKIAQELLFCSYHLRVSSSNWRKYFFVEEHWYIQLYTSATLPSRPGPTLRSTWRGVLICWHLDLKMSSTGLWGNSCCCCMGSVWGDKAHKRERAHPCNLCDKAFKYFETPKQHTVWQHSGHVFVCKGCGKKSKTNNIDNRQKKSFGFRPHHRKSFCNFSM